MSKTVGDYILERLHDWGVRRIFGYPGDGIGGLVAALGRDDKIDFVQTRHEEEAAFMACAHAKWTGEVGVCLATSGPGAIHLLNGLYDAKLDHQPVLAIVGQQARAALGGSYQQEVDLNSLFKDVAGEYVHTCMAPAQTRHLIDRSMRIAAAEKTVTTLIFPNDVQEEKAVETPPHAHGTVHSGIGFRAPRIVPQREDLEAAARILNEGEKVAILAGAGALEAGPALAQTAEALGAGVAKAKEGRIDVGGLVRRSGSSISRDLGTKRQADAPLDDGSGKLQVWRVEKMAKAPWPESKYGRFFDGDIHDATAGLHKWAQDRSRPAIEAVVAAHGAYNFTCVRNPYSRILSAFFDKILNAEPAKTSPPKKITTTYPKRNRMYASSVAL